MSYGTNAPQGLQVDTTRIGSTFSGQMNTYRLLSSYATAIYTGDPVANLNTGGIGIGVAGAAIQGVFQGVIYTDSSGTQVYSPYWTASTATFGTNPANALVVDDPNVVFNIQCGTSNSGTHTAALGLTDLNLNANFVIAAGSTRTGQSATYLDLATVNTTATLNLKIKDLTPVIGNAFDVLYNNALVTINNHVDKGGSGTLGV